jgi:hypothetical protein
MKVSKATFFDIRLIFYHILGLSQKRSQNAISGKNHGGWRILEPQEAKFGILPPEQTGIRGDELPFF